MSKEMMQLAEMLLKLKAKASQGLAWSEDEQATLARCFERQDAIRVLAACCVLSSERPKGCARSLSIIRETIEGQHPPPYVELLIYEALTIVESGSLEPLSHTIFRFIENSITKRSINLDNTIVLLGRLAKTGEAQALRLLRTLEYDREPGVRDNASRVLTGLKSQ